MDTTRRRRTKKIKKQTRIIYPRDYDALRQASTCITKVVEFIVYLMESMKVNGNVRPSESTKKPSRQSWSRKEESRSEA
jgi:hypothetical protein